jgi:hypothetical protein
MLAHAPADPWERTFLTDFVKRPSKVTLRHQADEIFDIDVQRACLNTSWILALQASERLDLYLLERKTECDLSRTT